MTSPSDNPSRRTGHATVAAYPSPRALHPLHAKEDQDRRVEDQGRRTGHATGDPLGWPLGRPLGRRLRHGIMLLFVALISCGPLPATGGFATKRDACATVRVESRAFDDVAVYHRETGRKLGTVFSLQPRTLRLCNLNRTSPVLVLRAIGNRWTRLVGQGLPTITPGERYRLEVDNTRAIMVPLPPER